LLAWRCSTAPTAYLSLDPDNAYLGNQACQPCHEKVYDSYLQTGMGHSLYRPDPKEVIEAFGPEVVVHDPQTGYHYHPFWENDSFFIREFRLQNGDTTYQRSERVDYVVGSGHQTRSYLMQRNGYLYELPITWYVNKGIWDLSPGYDVRNSRFEREIGQECLACHTGAFDFVEGSKNRYRQISLGIDCERCHGPGAEHVRLTEAGQLIDVGVEVDYSIVNPAKLPVSQQFDVCQQCHLQGINVLKPPHERIRDFRPPMALREVAEVFIEAPEDPEAFGIASHAERLQQSRCFIASEGQLTCTTCHDPHRSVSLTDSLVYVRQCQSCHAQAKAPACAAPDSALTAMDGYCISCHMPAGGTRDIPHVRFHDHKIRVLRPEPLANVAAAADYLRLRCATTDLPAADLSAKAWLQYYEQQDPDSGYLRLAAQGLSDSSFYARARLARYQGDWAEAERLAGQAVAQSPQDLERQFLLGEVREALGKYEAARAAYEGAFQQNPEAFEAGFKAGVCLLKARPGDRAALQQARQRFEQLQAMKPFDPGLLTNLGFVRLNLGEHAPAQQLLEQALSYDPFHAPALENLVALHWLRREAQAARAYLDRLREAEPEHPALAEWEGKVAGL